MYWLREARREFSDLYSDLLGALGRGSVHQALGVAWNLGIAYIQLDRNMVAREAEVRVLLRSLRAANEELEQLRAIVNG